MLLRLPIFFAKIDLKIKNIACLCFTQHPQFDSPPNWFVLYMFFEWQTPFMGNHGLISWNLLVKSIQSLEILQYDILKLPDAIHFIKTRVLPWKSSGVVSQMKVPPYLKKLRLCHDGADTSVVDEVVGAPICQCLTIPIYIRMPMNASISSRVTGLHFLLCLLGSAATCCSWYLLVSVTMSSHTSFVNISAETIPSLQSG